MTWKDKLIARLLLLLATMLADDPMLKDELHKIATHISVNAPKIEQAA
jgi:hypothetical protein